MLNAKVTISTSCIHTGGRRESRRASVRKWVKFLHSNEDSFVNGYKNKCIKTRVYQTYFRFYRTAFLYGNM